VSVVPQQQLSEAQPQISSTDVQLPAANMNDGIISQPQVFAAPEHTGLGPADTTLAQPATADTQQMTEAAQIPRLPPAQTEVNDQTTTITQGTGEIVEETDLEVSMVGEGEENAQEENSQEQ
jgi:hypothetical protein